MIFHFRLSKSILFFLIEFHCTFSFSYIVHYHVMFIIIVFDRVLTRSSSVSSQDFYCSLPMDQSRDVTPRLGVSIN